MKLRSLAAITLLVWTLGAPIALAVTTDAIETREGHVFSLSNDRVTCAVTVEAGRLIGDRITGEEAWLAEYGSEPFSIETDAGLVLDVMWNGWRAPKMVHNAANPVLFTTDDFALDDHAFLGDGETRSLQLDFTGTDNRFNLRVTYRLAADDFFVRRKIAIRDTTESLHFLRWTWPRNGQVRADLSILKPGGFGRPLAATVGDGGAFFGLEYPAAENALEQAAGTTFLRTGQEMGLRIGSDWLESDWSVAGITPNQHVKLWFDSYLDDIRVAPLRSYALYNSWYDVRSPEYTEREEDVMNEANLLRIVRDFERIAERYPDFKLDTFVLDDGWDVYKSDWVLRSNEFPNGLTPIARALSEMGTGLGIWFGPIGGYSYWEWRLEWMREHGYEIIGNRQLCIAGQKYHELFKRRVVDFVRDQDVSYFKWDGIQFSCSAPDHGHPVGIYSRRAVMESVADLCDAVRAERPDIFLNITSGTWLSPWWLRFANTIWMQGYDYGYADVPSVSQRDGAITYRDVVLYEDFGLNDFWFPIANLMTHGIIKGHLQQLGGEAEPLDKFTDNAILYFARGVAMWELYVSPNLLTDAEWTAIVKSMAWARDRFETLMSTQMIGGDPGRRETYGYAHFAGDRGIVAARNPIIERQKLDVFLSPAGGLNPGASRLVLERTYPTRWVSPRLYQAGETIELPLGGFETAIYEIYPLSEATDPLIAGVVFETARTAGALHTIRVLDEGPEMRILNPEYARMAGTTVSIPSGAALSGEVTDQDLRSASLSHALDSSSLTEYERGLRIEVHVRPDAQNAQLAILLQPDEPAGKETWPTVSAELDGAFIETKNQTKDGSWGWYVMDAEPGAHQAMIEILPAEGTESWSGTAQAWLIYFHRPPATTLEVEYTGPSTGARPLPPRPWEPGTLRRNQRIGEVAVSAQMR